MEGTMSQSGYSADELKQLLANLLTEKQVSNEQIAEEAKTRLSNSLELDDPSYSTAYALTLTTVGLLSA
jgi:hypothetical protein